jgi:hypothetical protein
MVKDVQTLAAADAASGSFFWATEICCAAPPTRFRAPLDPTVKSLVTMFFSLTALTLSRYRVVALSVSSPLKQMPSRSLDFGLFRNNLVDVV